MGKIKSELVFLVQRLQLELELRVRFQIGPALKGKRLQIFERNGEPIDVEVVEKVFLIFAHEIAQNLEQILAEGIVDDRGNQREYVGFREREFVLLLNVFLVVFVFELVLLDLLPFLTE